MDKSVQSRGVSRSVQGKRVSVAARTEPGRPGSRSLSVGLFFSQAPLFSPVQHAMANMADITNSCSARLRSSGPAPRSHQQPFPRSYARMRGAEARGALEKEGPWMWRGNLDVLRDNL